MKASHWILLAALVAAIVWGAVSRKRYKDCQAHSVARELRLDSLNRAKKAEFDSLISAALLTSKQADTVHIRDTMVMWKILKGNRYAPAEEIGRGLMQRN